MAPIYAFICVTTIIIGKKKIRGRRLRRFSSGTLRNPPPPFLVRHYVQQVVIPPLSLPYVYLALLHYYLTLRTAGLPPLKAGHGRKNRKARKCFQRRPRCPVPRSWKRSLTSTLRYTLRYVVLLPLPQAQNTPNAILRTIE